MKLKDIFGGGALSLVAKNPEVLTKGLIPAIVDKKRADRSAEKAKRLEEEEAMRTQRHIDGALAAQMFAGGKTSRKRPIDGAAVRGKTKGRIV
jgi:hypothetical protein